MSETDGYNHAHSLSCHRDLADVVKRNGLEMMPMQGSEHRHGVFTEKISSKEITFLLRRSCFTHLME